MSDLTEFAIARLELRDGDVLVVRAPMADEAERTRRHKLLSDLVPAGVKVLQIDPLVELSVLTRAEIEAKVG